jgi:hypothetical protein
MYLTKNGLEAELGIDNKMLFDSQHRQSPPADNQTIKRQLSTSSIELQR